MNRPKVCYSIGVRKNPDRRDLIMVYSFILEGENIDGDLIAFELEYNNYESFSKACNAVEGDAISILEDEHGGHIDIFNIDGKFINDVEV